MVYQRHSIRLIGFDYSSKALYFVTVCTFEKENIFGEVRNNKMILNQFGGIVKFIWESLPERFHIKNNEFQIMPNHIHGIIIVGAIHESPLQTRDTIFKRSLLSQIIGYLKMNSSKQIHAINSNIPVWQRNYYERIIRNEKEFIKIQEYIRNNPKNWGEDFYNK